MKIVILQPTFLPWLGYFDLIDQSDIFVFLDSVQFNKRSWQQRNKIKTPKGLEWVTIPVKVKGLSEQIIAETILQDAPSFFSKVQNQLKFNYGNSPFFGSYFDSFLDAFHFGINQSNLCDLNINLILWFAEKLNIESQFIRSSEFDFLGQRSELLIEICDHFNSQDYLSPYGSKEYLIQDQPLFEQAGISISLHDYNHPKYNQLFPPFMEFASVFDLLMNEGPISGEIICSGRSPSINL